MILPIRILAYWVCAVVVLGMDSSAAWARTYTVELIIFQRNPAQAASAEQWSMQSSALRARQEQFEALRQKAKQYALTDSLARLGKLPAKLTNAGHRVLTTARWTQPAALYHRAPLVALGNLAEAQNADWRGFVRVYRTALIFVDMNLQFIAPADRQEYFITEKRRLKFGQVHYFDHPKFGAIMGVW